MKLKIHQMCIELLRLPSCLVAEGETWEPLPHCHMPEDRASHKIYRWIPQGESSALNVRGLLALCFRLKGNSDERVVLLGSEAHQPTQEMWSSPCLHSSLQLSLAKEWQYREGDQWPGVEISSSFLSQAHWGAEVTAWVFAGVFTMLRGVHTGVMPHLSCPGQAGSLLRPVPPCHYKPGHIDCRPQFPFLFKKRNCALLVPHAPHIWEISSRLKHSFIFSWKFSRCIFQTSH